MRVNHKNMLNKRMQIQKKYTLNDSICMESKNRQNSLWYEKSEQWLNIGWQEWTGRRKKDPLRGDGDVLYPDQVADCWEVPTYQNSLNCTFKIYVAVCHIPPESKWMYSLKERGTFHLEGLPGDKEIVNRDMLQLKRPYKGAGKWEKPKAEEEQRSGRVRRETEKTESEGEGTSQTGRHEWTEHQK